MLNTADTTGRGRLPDGSAAPVRLGPITLGGIELTARWPAALGMAPAAVVAELDAALCDGPGMARLDVRLSAMPAAPRPDLEAAARAHYCAVRPDGDALVLSGARLQGRVRPTAAGFVADLSVPAHPYAAAGGLCGAAAAVAETLGRPTLHAAGTVLPDGVVLFIGPSGAGKSTACLLAGDHPCFTYDEARVALQPDGPVAFRLPGGTPVSRPLSSSSKLPLLGILQVQQGTGAPHIRPLSPIDALFQLRAATVVGDASLEAESRRLDVAQRLATAVPVGTLTTVLGRPIDHLLDAWLRRPTEAHGLGGVDVG